MPIHFDPPQLSFQNRVNGATFDGRTEAWIIKALRHAPEDAWEKTKAALAGRKVHYLGEAQGDDMADTPVSLIFRKDETEALDAVIAGIMFQRKERLRLSHAEQQALKAKGDYGIVIQSISPLRGTGGDIEMRLSPASMLSLNNLLPEKGKLDLAAFTLSAGHLSTSFDPVRSR